MLSELISREQLQRALAVNRHLRAFPAASDRAAWQGLLDQPLNQLRRDWILAEAQRLVREPWPQISMSLLLEFKRNGNRSRFEAAYFARRRFLAVWALAECFTADGQFLEPLLNGLWSVCEEASWCIPAHAEYADNDPLPMSEPFVVDLFAAETAADLATILSLLEPVLQQQSPGLCRIMRQKIDQRVLTPALTQYFWWMKGENNWCPWCAASVLHAALVAEPDAERLTAIASKMLQALDRYLAQQPSDGSCDEGPMYWQVAAAQMFLFLDDLHRSTGGQFNPFELPLIRLLGEFPCRVHLTGDYFANFCDAEARLRSFPRATTYRYGAMVHSQDMMNFALFAASNWGRGGTPESLLNISGQAAPLFAALRDLFWLPASIPAVTLIKPLATWLPDLQLLVARETTDSGRGLILTAKGGHNGVNHNHNDAGHFCVFADSQPVIVDLGTEEYCRATFNAATRHTLLCIRSSSHNAPLINGIEQATGAEFRAEAVKMRETGRSSGVAMELAHAFPKDSGILSLHRECRLERDGAAVIRIIDAIAVATAPATITLTLFAAAEPVEVTPGVMRFALPDQPVFMTWPQEQMQAAITLMPLTDKRLVASWGERLWKITLTLLAAARTVNYSLSFSQTTPSTHTHD